ncbi:hypothetical protein BVG81_000925 [Haliangium sp. UPWRP_2]|nr:hypothetical protein BVG81_000925 [Haliangium sp. UPWRP_2]
MGIETAALRHRRSGHSSMSAVVYRWRTVAQHATTTALQQEDSCGKSQPEALRTQLQGTSSPPPVVTA